MAASVSDIVQGLRVGAVLVYGFVYCQDVLAKDAGLVFRCVASASWACNEESGICVDSFNYKGTKFTIDTDRKVFRSDIGNSDIVSSTDEKGDGLRFIGKNGWEFIYEKSDGSYRIKISPSRIVELNCRF